MEKINGFQITALHLEGFKSFAAPTTLTFGDPTAITGGNRSRKIQHCRRHCLCGHGPPLLWGSAALTGSTVIISPNCP